jgi:hypothetical protein
MKAAHGRLALWLFPLSGPLIDKLPEKSRRLGDVTKSNFQNDPLFLMRCRIAGYYFSKGLSSH